MRVNLKQLYHIALRHKMSSLEQDIQVKGDITENGANSTGPQRKPPSKKKSTKNISVKKSKSVSKDASNAQLASDTQATATSEMTNQDKALQNYNQANGEGNDESSKTLTKKKSKTSKVRLSKVEGKSAEEDSATASKDPENVQELTKLKECLECEWGHNYHPCLLSDRADNAKCKDEMKRKGYDYKEPKQQCCLKKRTCDVNTADSAVDEEKTVSEPPPPPPPALKPKRQPSFKKPKQSKQKSKPAIATNKKVRQNQEQPKPELSVVAEENDEQLKPEIVTPKQTDEQSKPEIVTPKQTDEQSKPPIVTSKQTEEPYRPPIVKSKRTMNEESKPVIVVPKPTEEQLSSKPTIIISRPTQPVIVFSKPNQNHSKPSIIISKRNPEQSEPPKPKKIPSVKIKPSSSKTKAHVNFDKEAPPKTASTASLKKKPSKTSSKSKGVKPVSSKQDTSDLISKITTKSKKKLGGDKHASSVPVSTRESRTRFNPRQPSPSDTNLPPVTISASQVKCFNPEMTTSTGICETPAPPRKTKSKSAKSTKSTLKKEKDASELVVEGETTACDWHKNYHSCDKLNDNATGTDQIICKAWKKKLKELDPQAKSTKSSLKSILESVQSTALTTTPSEKAYIDKVVRTAVKLAKKNNPTIRRRRRSRVDSISSGFSRVNSMVDNAISAAAAVVHTHPRPMTCNKKSKRSAGSTASLNASQVHGLVESGIVVDSNRMPRTGKPKSKKGSIAFKSVPSLASVSQSSSKKRIHPN